MKKQVLSLSVAILLGAVAFGQKAELKTAEKAIKKGNFTAAAGAIDQATPLIENADNKLKAKYYFLKAKSVYANGENADNLDKAAKAFQQLIDFEKEIGSSKYTNKAGQTLNTIIQNLDAKAQEAYKVANQSKASADYEKAALGFYNVYAASPKDTTYLYNASIFAVLAKNYQQNIDWSKQLLDMKYSGSQTVYTAKNSDGTTFGPTSDKAAIELQKKLGQISDVQTEVTPSKVVDITRNLIISYRGLGKNEEALKAIQAVRKQFPNEFGLILEEANVYLALGDQNKFKELLQEAVKIDGSNPQIYFNIGVISLEQGDKESALKNFKKVLELDPKNAQANLQIAAVILKDEAAIVEEMNQNLSNFDKYDELKLKQLELYKKAIPYILKAQELDPTNETTIRTLIGMYENLEDSENQAKMQAKLDALEK